MEIDRDIERFGALQDRPEELVVQIAAARVPIDERAFEALLPNPALQFFGRLVWCRDRQGGKAGEALRIFLHRLGEEIVGLPGNRDLLRRVRLLDPWRVEREHLHVDAGGIHVGDALVADILKLIVNPGAARTRIAEPLGELLAWTREESRADEMFFKGDGTHLRSVVWCITISDPASGPGR